MREFDITKRQFESYLRVQKQTGKVSMWGVHVPHCTPDEVVYIIQHFDELRKLYDKIVGKGEEQ